jgi:hypothetical protein
MAQKLWDFWRRNCGTWRRNYGILQAGSWFIMVVSPYVVVVYVVMVPGLPRRQTMIGGPLCKELVIL